MNEELKNKLKTAKKKIFLADPFIGFVMRYFEIEITDNCPTASTNGRIIIFGRKFLASLTPTDTIFVLMHEMLHVILGHPFRMKNRDPLRFNVACDIIVNDIISSYGYRAEKIQAIYGKYYGFNSFFMTVETIYSLLDGMNLPKFALDEHIWEMLANADGSKYRPIWQAIQEALDNGYKPRNAVLRKTIKKPLYVINKNNWKKILEKYIDKDLFDYTYDRTDNRYSDVLLPSFRENEDALKKIWFLIDVSASIDDETLASIAGEMDRIANHFRSLECDISFFSIDTTRPVKFRNRKDLIIAFMKAETKFGTNFIQIFASIDKYYKHNKPGLMVIFTDGYAMYPKPNERKHIPVIWCLTAKSEKPPFGKIIYLHS